MAEQPAHLRADADTIVWCKYHCATCDECFRSLAAFDAHRRGSYHKNTRHCCEPDEMERSDGEPLFEGLEGRCRLANEKGVWESIIWRLARDEEEE